MVDFMNLISNDTVDNWDARINLYDRTLERFCEKKQYNYQIEHVLLEINCDIFLNEQLGIGNKIYEI